MENISETQPLDFDISRNESDAIYRLSKLNQFIEAELESNYCHRYKGCINLINGCFVHVNTKEFGSGLFRKGKKVTGISLVWQSEDMDAAGHSVFLHGDEIEKYISLMEKQSNQFS